MEIQTNEREIAGRKAAVISIVGEIDRYNSDQLYSDDITSLIENKEILVFDFEKVEYIDSTGLNQFIKILKICREKEKSFILISLNNGVQKTFEITGLVRIIPILNNFQEIKEFLENEKKESVTIQ